MAQERENLAAIKEIKENVVANLLSSTFFYSYCPYIHLCHMSVPEVQKFIDRSSLVFLLGFIHTKRILTSPLTLVWSNDLEYSPKDMY
jgi:hypothetical protein